MTTIEFERILNTARGYLELNLPADALNAIEELPFTDCRLHPDAIALRLLVYARLKRWELGVHLLETVWDSHPVACRAAAGTFLFAHAVEMCECGRPEWARNSVRRLSMIYPEGFDLVAAYPALLGMWP